MTIFQTFTVSVFSHDFMTNHGVLEGVSYATQTEEYDRVGSGMIRVPVNAANVDQIQIDRYIVAVTATSIADPIYPAFFIIRNLKYVIDDDDRLMVEVSGPGALDELVDRSVGENVLAGTIDATLDATVDPETIQTTLANTASGGATSIVVSSATDFAVGQPIVIYLDDGGRHDTSITSVAGTTIGIAGSMPSAADDGNKVTTETGYVLSVNVVSGSFVVGQAAHVTLDDGTEHAGSIIGFTAGTPATLTINPGIPSIATSGNAVFQYTFTDDVITEIMAYAPSDWTATITGNAAGMLFGANETVLEALLQAHLQTQGHFRFVVDPTATRELEWLDSPDTMDITDFLVAGTEYGGSTDDFGIIESLSYDISEQARQVTRVFVRGAMGLKFTRAQPFVTPAAGYTVDWNASTITDTAAESGGARRVERHLPLENIQATGATEGELTEAAILLYNTAETWLGSRDNSNPIFYEALVVIQRPLKPYSTVHVTYSAPGISIDDDLIIHSFTYEFDAKSVLKARVKLSNIEPWRQQDGDDATAGFVRRVDNALRHIGTIGAVSGGILPSSYPAATHDEVTIGIGGLSAHLAITPSTQILTLSDIDYSEISNRQHDIVGADHAGTGGAFDVVGFTATDTLGTLTPSSNPGATEALLKTGSGGGVQLLRVGIGVSPTVDNTIRMVDDAYIGIGGAAGRLAFEDDTTDLLRVYDGIFRAPMVGGGTTPTVAIHALATGNATAIQAEAPSLTSSPALSVQNIPLSSDVDTGKGIEVKATSESFGRVMIYSDGKIGVGAGSSTRDTFLSRSAANTWLVSSNGGSGAGNIRFNNGAYAGLGPSAGRFVFVDAATDLIRCTVANFAMNDGTTDRLTLRYSGDVDTTEADIYAHSQGGFAADSNIGIFIDADNNSTDASFRIFKNDDDFANATEIARITEAGMMFINDNANGDGTIGITINQGANDDDVITAKSSDVATGVTGEAETDTFFSLRKQNGNAGGARLMGLTEDVIAWQMRAIGTNTDTTSTAAGVAPALVVSALKSGTSVATYGSTDNIFAVRNNNSTRFIIKGNGDIYYDGTANTYDEFDDVAMIRLAQRETAVSGFIESEFDKYITIHRDELEAAGLVTFNPDGHHFVNVTGMQRLICGGIWQLHKRIARLEEALL